jgi:hypothetical protein
MNSKNDYLFILVERSIARIYVGVENIRCFYSTRALCFVIDYEYKNEYLFILVERSIARICVGVENIRCFYSTRALCFVV